MLALEVTSADTDNSRKSRTTDEQSSEEHIITRTGIHLGASHHHERGEHSTTQTLIPSDAWWSTTLSPRGGRERTENSIQTA